MEVADSFRYISINTSEEECEAIVQDLIDKKILVRMTYDEIYDAMVNIKHSEVYPFLLAEPRYKIASQALSEFIADRNSLQYFFTKRFEAVSLIPPDMRQKEFESQCYNEQHDGYQYYLGLKITNNLRTRQKVEHKKMLLPEKDNRKRKVDRKVIEAYSSERSKWDDCIKNKLKEIRNKQEYAEIRNEFPSLHEVLIKPLRNISRALGLYEREFD